MIEPTDKEVIGAVRKNRYQTVRVSPAEWGGRPYVYLHTLPHLEGKPDSEAEERPGGFTLAPSVWRSLLPLIEQACGRADKQGGVQGAESQGPPPSWDADRRRGRIRGNWETADER